MTIPSISRTCIYVAAGRALGAREPDPTVRNPDDLAERLLGDPAALHVDHPVVRALALPYDDAMSQPEVVNIVRMMMIRTRFIDAALERAIAAGATQLVILGAGFDSHAYRYSHLLEHVRVFEVDRSATQALKRERVRLALGAVPANVTYVAIDFQHDDLADVLARHGHDLRKRTFFIMEGVTMYVPEEGIRRTLRFVGDHAGGSGIVFDFVPRAMIEMLAGIDMNNIPAAARPFLQRFLDLIKDEPWVFGIPLGSEATFLGEFGMDVREVLTIGGPESVARYLTKTDGTQVGAKTLEALMAKMAAGAADSGGAPAGQPQMTLEQVREQQRQRAYQLAEAVVRA
jgi:methyltransferase (TIGR00027 family)